MRTAKHRPVNPKARVAAPRAATNTERLHTLAAYINDNATETLRLAALARRVGWSPAHLQRRFVAEFGVSPKQMQDAARMQQLKQALHRGAPVTKAIYDAGYGSSSRVYGEATRNLGMTPSKYRSGAVGESIAYATRKTALGWTMMAATNRGVCFVQFGDSPAELLAQLRAEFPKALLEPSRAQDSVALDAWIAALDAHLAHGAPRPDVPLDLRGTAFQIRVWRFLLKIPAGAVMSYGEVANGIGQPAAARAVGTACGSNKVGVLIPCHRVLRGDGNLGGYRWGLERKRALLDAERTASPSSGDSASLSCD